MIRKQWTWKSLAVCFLTLGLMSGCAGCGPEDENNSNNTQQCTTNEDCPGDRICGDDGTCRMPEPGFCEEDTDCDFDEYCAAGTCEDSACEDDEDCMGGAICDTGLCRAGCRANADCEDGQVCNMSLNKCEAAGCLSTGCQAIVEECDDSLDVPRCVPTGECDADAANPDAQCALYANFLDDGNEYLCDTSAGKCTIKPACMSDGDCDSNAGEICVEREEARNICREGCREDANCGSDEFCDVEGSFNEDGQTLTCVQGCLLNEDCNDILEDPDGSYACIDLKCVPNCQNLDDCEVGLICTGQPRICRPCQNDNQCPAGQFCDLTQIEEVELDGLCQPLPPACPPDMYGDNHDLAGAYTIDAFPFVADGTMEDVEQPNFCRENDQGEWFLVQADSGQVITVTVEYASGGVNLNLALKNSNGEDLVVSAREPDVDNGTESIRYGVRTGDDFYIQVRGSLGDDRIPYTLTVDVDEPPPCTDDAFEDNDTEDTAAALPAETDHVGLQVCGDDPDFYALEVDNNQIVTVDAIAPVRQGNIDLYVTAPDGTPIEPAVSSDDNEQLRFDAQQGGTYTLEVVIAGGVGNVDYDLRWRQTPNLCNDIYDPNGGCAMATSLDGEFMPGMDPGTIVYENTEELYVCPEETEADWYKLTLLAAAVGHGHGDLRRDAVGRVFGSAPAQRLHGHREVRLAHA